MNGILKFPGKLTKAYPQMPNRFLTILNNIFPPNAFKNIIYILMTRVYFLSASFLMSVMVARKLGLVGFGIYALALSLYTMVELIANLGLDNIIVPRVAQDHSTSGSFFSHGAFIGIFSSITWFFLLMSVSYLMKYPLEIRMAICQIGILFFPSFLFYLLESIFIGLQKSKHVFICSLFRDTILLVMSALVLHRGGNVYAIINVMFIARVMGLMLFLYLARRQGIRLVAPIDYSFLKNVGKLIPIFFVIGACFSFFLEIDSLILSKVLSISEFGIYSVAKRMVRAGGFFYLSVITAFFPSISQHFLMSKEFRILLFKRLARTIFLLILALILLISLFSKMVIIFFFGQKYSAAVQYVQVLAWALIPLSFSFLSARFLIAGNQQNKELSAVMCGIVCLIFLGIFSSVKWGGMGMAMAYILSASVMAAICYYFTMRLLYEDSAGNHEAKTV